MSSWIALLLLLLAACPLSFGRSSSVQSSQSLPLTLTAPSPRFFSSPSAAVSNFTLTDIRLGLRFDGVGAISGGGATSRLLPSYDPTVLSEVLDYLFLPDFGASLHWLKVEIGGEGTSTEGSEATHARTIEELYTNPQFNRGYEWMLMVEAKKRNPSIGLYGLSWAWPGYLRTANISTPWANVSLSAEYTVAWVKGAKDVYDLDIDVLGVWNERSYSADYILSLRRLLDASGFPSTGILCDDNAYSCAKGMLANESLMDAVKYVGGHGTPTADAALTHKPMWFSEDFHNKGGEFGASVWADQINNRYIQHNMTATLAWNAVDAFLRGLSYDDTGLMNARCPWSQSYEVLATIWATAHTTQFTQPGWYYLPVGSGSGPLAAGGSLVTYVDRSTTPSNFTVVIEKFNGYRPNTSQPETVNLCLGGSLRWAISTPLAVWRSSFDQGSVQPHYLERQPPVTPDSTGCFTLTVEVGTLTTITSLKGGQRGRHPDPPPCQPFPLPYQHDFESCVPPAEADYFSDVSGTWECVDVGGQHGVVMRMQTPMRPLSWELQPGDDSPNGVIGDRYWTDVSVTVEVRLNAPGDSFMLGQRVNMANLTDYDCVKLQIYLPGMWMRWD